MKYETKMRVLNFANDVRQIKVVGDWVYDAVTGQRGPSFAVMKQAYDLCLIDFDSADRLFLTDKGRETLSPTKMRRLSYLVPLEHVAAVNSMVNEYLMGVQNENRS